MAAPVVRIGTPRSPGATRVMLLGSGELGKEVAIELQRLGVEVIAVDRYADAPAQQLAHSAHVIDMSDRGALRDLILRERPDLVVPEIEALATDVLVDLEAQGQRVVPTARAAALTMDREGVRRLAAEDLGLPTSPYAFVSSADALQAAAAEIGYPCFVKPVVSSSGKGQSRVEREADIRLAWDAAMAGGRVGRPRVIVEGRIDFDFEITLLTVRARAPSGEVETRLCAPIGHRQVDGDYVESWQPQPLSPTALAAAQDMARRITAALAGERPGLGVFGVELFVRGDQVWFSEVSPRPHDTGLVTLVTQAKSEFALHARAILGLPVDTTLREPGASAVIYGGVDAPGVAFEGLQAALAVPGTELRLFGKPLAFARRRMGVALARAVTTDAARAAAQACAAAVRVVAGA